MNERDISSELSFLQRLSDQGMFCANLLGETWYKDCLFGYTKMIPSFFEKNWFNNEVDSKFNDVPNK